MRSGFTLIHLLVVLAILAILAAILFPVFANHRDLQAAAAPEAPLLMHDDDQVTGTGRPTDYVPVTCDSEITGGDKNVRMDQATGLRAVQDPSKFEIVVEDGTGKTIAGPVSGRLGGLREGVLTYFDADGRKWRLDTATAKPERAFRQLHAQQLMGDSNVVSIADNLDGLVKKDDMCPILGGESRRIESVEVKLRKKGEAFTTLHLASS